MNTQQIQYILEVYKTRSMSKAAANLYVAQPNLSNAIRALEQELGFAVFSRSNRGVFPTEKGLLVLERANRIWNDYQKMRQINSSVSCKRIRIGGVSLSPTRQAFEKLCLELQNEPNVDISFDTYVQVNFASLAMGNLDILIALLPWGQTPTFAARAATKEIMVTSVKQMPIVLHIGQNHPLYGKEQIEPQELADYPFVDYTLKIYQDFPEIDTLLPVNRDRIIMVTDRMIKHRLVSAGNFISLGCKLTESESKAYGFRDIQIGDISYDLVLLERMGQKRSPVLQRYVQLLEKELKTL